MTAISYDIFSLQRKKAHLIEINLSLDGNRPALNYYPDMTQLVAASVIWRALNHGDAELPAAAVPTRLSKLVTLLVHSA